LLILERRHHPVILALALECSAVVIALRFGIQGPWFEPCLFHKACLHASSWFLSEAKTLSGDLSKSCVNSSAIIVFVIQKKFRHFVF
jgi:hypothetical protein